VHGCVKLALTIVLACLAAACTDPTPAGGPDAACGTSKPLLESSPGPELDLVLVISDAPEMAAYHDALVANLRAWVDVLDTLDGGRPSVRIAVVDGSGHVVDPVLTDLRLPWFWCPEATCHYPEFDGDLHDVLAAEGDVGAGGAAAPPLLARLEDALDQVGFDGPSSWLGVVIVGGADDASPDAPAAYAARLEARRPGQVSVAVVAGADTPRLDAFAAAFPDRAGRVSIDGTDWSDAFGQFNVYKTTLGLPCLPAGLTADQCTAAEADGTPIPPCQMIDDDRPDPRTPLPCFRLAPSPAGQDPASCARYGIVERSQAGPAGLAPTALVSYGCAP